MTDHFEVTARDGPARLGEVRLSDPIRTPALLGDRLSDAGSEWIADQDPPDGDPSTLTILPHRALPAGIAPEVADAFAPATRDVAYPSAVVVAPQTAGDYGADAYVLSGASGYVGHAAAFVDAILRTRDAIPADTALYLPGVATPANAAMLVYTGVDLLDSDRAYIRGLEGFYLATDGEHFLADLEERPCVCPECSRPRDSFDREACARHNVHALEAELARVRERIRGGRLRDYVEGQARHEAWLTATLRRLDQDYGYLEGRTPILRQAELLAASEASLDRVEIKRFADRVCNRYRCRFDVPLVLVPCSARKPYSASRSHRQFHDAIQWRGHIVSVTSPIGIVPQELELTYPAQHYEAVVTGVWSEDEQQFVAEVLRRYLDRATYPEYIAHVPADYRPICERVEASADITFEYTVVDHPTTEASLDQLALALDGTRPYPKREREHNTIRAIADYLVGDGAGDMLFDEITTTGQYPKLQVRRPGDREQLATLVPQYGTLSFTLAGAHRWVESDAPTKRVAIDDFVPHGSVLAPGVRDATDAIRVGDEVVVDGPAAFGVGRAAMSGPEMTESTRGVAVDVRHTEAR